MSKVIYRYRVPVDDVDFETPTGQVVHVAADRDGDPSIVEVWVEHPHEIPGAGGITLNVHGSGHLIPDGESVHVGSCISGPFVWHVYATYDDGGRI